MTEELSFLQQAYDLIAKYRVETTLTGLWLLNPVFTFMLVQRAKKIAPATLNRRMSGAEVVALASVASIGLTFAVGYVFAGLKLDVLAVHAVLIAIALPTLIRLIMGWAKDKHPSLYVALKNDRRKVDKDVPIVDRRDETTLFL